MLSFSKEKPSLSSAPPQSHPPLPQAHCLHSLKCSNPFSLSLTLTSIYIYVSGSFLDSKLLEDRDHVMLHSSSIPCTLKAQKKYMRS